jgi:hypothetical protein
MHTTTLLSYPRREIIGQRLRKAMTTVQEPYIIFHADINGFPEKIDEIKNYSMIVIGTSSFHC